MEKEEGSDIAMESVDDSELAMATLHNMVEYLLQTSKSIIMFIDLIKESDSAEDINTYIDLIQELDSAIAVANRNITINMPVREKIRNGLGDFSEIRQKCIDFGVV